MTVFDENMKSKQVKHTRFFNLHLFLCQGILCDFGLEGFLGFHNGVLHPVEVLSCITTRGTSWSCWARVGFNAGSHEKHLDDGEDCLL